MVEPTSPRVEAYTSSVADDARLGVDDVDGSLAHVRMLRATGILTAAEMRAISSGLLEIRGEFERGAFEFTAGDEDVHTAVERRLFELTGDIAGKLHSGRSRNDQVATDLRLYARRACRDLALAAASLQRVLLEQARNHRSTLLPGYTHGQRAQVITLAHQLLAYVEMLHRDVERLGSAYSRCDVLPLGSGALAGSTLPLDRQAVAADLGFGSVGANSIDSVSDRDFAVELVFGCALLMVHCSRISEDMVLWSTSEFGFVELADSHATGSSLMPQKKNPDVFELVRGRAARVIGDLTTLLVVLKGLPLAYDRDLQEDKRPVFDAVDVTRASLDVLSEVIAGVTFDVAAMRAAASDPSLLATDVAEHLVQRGVPFRDAHRLVATAVRKSLSQQRTLRDLSLAEWRAISPAFDAGTPELFDLDTAVRRRDLDGGPGPSAIGRQLSRAAAQVAATERRFARPVS